MDSARIPRTQHIQIQCRRGAVDRGNNRDLQLKITAPSGGGPERGGGGGEGILDELKVLAKPLVDYLRENHHPHTTIIVTYDRVVVVEDVIGIPFPTEDAAEEFPHSLSDFETCQLVDELNKREGVDTVVVDPNDARGICVGGPATVLVVTD